MKKLALLFSMATALFACNNSGQGTAASSGKDSSQADNNLAINRKFTNAIVKGDSAFIMQTLASDAVDHEGESGQEVKGAANISKMLVGMHSHYKDLSMDITDDAANGDMVFARLHFSGTAIDSSGGNVPGKKMDMHGVDVTKYKNGKATEHWGYYDPNEMMKMMMEAHAGKDKK